MERFLGTGETFWWRLGRSNAANLVLTANLQGKVSLDTLREALALAQRRHPLLAVWVDSGDGRPRFVQDLSLKIPVRVVERTDPDLWRHEAEDEINTKISSEIGPLIQLVLIHGADASDIVFNFHHCICDGRSVACTVRDILSFYQQLSEGVPPEVPCEPLPPAYDTCLDPKYTRLFRTRSVLALVRQQIRNLRTREKQLAVSESDGDERSYLHLVFVSLTRAESKALLAQCRANQTTVFGAASAAYLMAINRHLKLGKGERVNLLASIGLRDFLQPPVPDEVLFFAVSGFAKPYAIDDSTTLWSLARDIRTRTVEGIDRAEMFFPGIFLRRIFFHLRRSQEAFVGAVAKKRIFVHLTNVGVLKVPPAFGALKVTGVLEAATVNARQTGVISVVLSTFDGRAGFCFEYATPTVTPELAEDVMANTMAILRAHLQSQDNPQSTRS